MRALSWTSLLFLLALTGCAGTRTVAEEPRVLPAGFPFHTIDQIRTGIGASSDTLFAFDASASLTIRSPERSGRFSAQMRARRGDSLYIGISPGLGIEAARILATTDSLFLYDRIQNELTVGDLTAAGRMLALPLTPEDLFRNLLGLLYPDADTPWQITSDSLYYHLSDPGTGRTLIVDPSLWRVVRYEQRTADDTVLEEREFSDFDRFGSVLLPRRVVLRRLLDDSGLSLYYRDLNLNPDGLAIPWRVSDSARRRVVAP